MRLVLAGCEYGNRAGWCDSYLTNRAGCLQDDNAFWCCQTCATVYGGKSPDLHVASIGVCGIENIRFRKCVYRSVQYVLSMMR